MVQSTTPSLLEAGLAEVTDRITGLAGRTEPLRVDESGMGRLRTIKTPMQRKAAKTGYSFSSESRATQLAIWDHVWRSSDLMEVMFQALYAYEYKPPNRSEVSRIRSWVDRCMCWEHSDSFSKIFADVVEQNPQWILPTLRKWNRSSNPWERRQSVVALIEYASKRSRFLPYEVMIAQVESLLDDEDYYVQKGVGWTIREIDNAYPDQISKFLDRHAARLAPQAWTGATKNMDKVEKARLKELRNRS